MTQQLITGGNGVSGQSGSDIKEIINENFTELYTRNMNVLDHDLVGNGIVNDATALNTLLSTIGSYNTDLYFPSGTYKISTNVSIPSNVRIIMANGAMFSVDVNRTVAIIGDVEAGLYQIFSGAGRITAGWNRKGVYPQWFGVIADADPAVDMYTALTSLFASILTNYIDLHFVGGSYTLGTSITIPASVRMVMNKGADINIASTKILTINGEIDAGIYQIFSGLGSVAGTLINKYIYSEWFGNVTNNTTVATETELNVKTRGLLGDGSANDATILNTLITSIGSTITDLYFPKGTYKISTNVVLPSNVRLIMGYGAVLKVSNGVSITGTNTKIEAGLYQIFDLSLGGTLAGSWDIKEVYPQWFGATGDGVTDDSVAIIKSFTTFNKPLYIPEGTYIINITAGVNHDNRNFCSNVIVNRVKGIKKKSIIKLGSANCNELNYRGFSALFQWQTGIDLDLEIDSITFDYNYSNNIPYHYQNQYSGVENNSQNYAIAYVDRRDLIIRDCEFIDHSGTNIIAYSPNNNNTRTPVIKIAHNQFKNIGYPAKFITGGNTVDAYHDHSTLSIHNHTSTVDEGTNLGMISYIYGNTFIGVGGNAYNPCECSATIQYYHNNTVDKFYISNLVCPSREDVVVHNHHNISTNLAQGIGIFSHKNESIDFSKDAYKLINIHDNLYSINIDYHKTIDNWGNPTLDGDYYEHFYVGCFWGDRYRNIDTLKFDNNTVEFVESEDVTLLGTDAYIGCGIGFATFTPASVALFVSNPTLQNLEIVNNTFKNCYRNVLKYSTYPKTVNIKLNNNKIFNCGHEDPGVYNLFNIEMVGDGVGYPYVGNANMHVYNESIECYGNQVFNSFAKSLMVVAFREVLFSVSTAILRYKNNITNIPFVYAPYYLTDQGESIVNKIVDDRYINIITNFSFVDGTDTWSGSETTLSIVDSQLETTDNATTAEHYVSQTLSTAPVALHKYYVSSNIYKNGGQIYIYNKRASAAYEQEGYSAVTLNGKCSGVFTVTDIHATPSFFIRLYRQTGSFLGALGKGYFNNIIVVDLTAHFGAGYEPSKSWCDKNINVSNVSTI